jgi:hypothetical protein
VAASWPFTLRTAQLRSHIAATSQSCTSQAHHSYTADLEKHGVPDSLLRDLAFSTGAVLAAYLSLLSALPATAFKSRDDASGQGDEDAHELVDSLMKM